MSLKFSRLSPMSRWGNKSPLRSEVIKDSIINKKDRLMQDFEFKITNIRNAGSLYSEFDFEISHYEKIILKVHFEEEHDPTKINEERFAFDVSYFNPQTDNDAQVINHFIAQAKELMIKKQQHKDKGNVDIINNNYVFKKRKTFYSYPLIWSKGRITENNFDKELSYEFATEMYLNQVKKVYQPKKLQRRKIKKFMDDTVGLIKKQKILESFEKDD